MIRFLISGASLPLWLTSEPGTTGVVQVFQDYPLMFGQQFVLPLPSETARAKIGERI